MVESARRPQSGFTLIEVLVVTVVIGILASIALAALISAIDRSKQRATMADMRTISRAVEAYMVDNNQPPSGGGGLTALQPVLIPYQAQVLPIEDHWQNGYDFVSNVANGDYTLESFGKDGVDGTDVTVGTRFDYNLDIVLVNGSFLAAPE